jgi:nucleoside-diphosphate-sugar epimerase
VPPEALGSEDPSDDRPVLALTGATGFIGGAVAVHFAGAGWRVRALVRGHAPTTPPRLENVELVRGSLADQPALDRLVDGAEAVVHCAGAVRGWGERDFDQVNVDGLVNVVAAAARRGLPGRFVSLSSLAAREPRLSPYAASKRRGEQALAEKADGMPWVALRPPAVYGPGDPASTPLLRSLMRGFALVPGAASNRFSLLHVDDLVTAIDACVSTDGAPSSGVFELHDGRPGGYDWRDLAGIASELRGKAVRTVVVPKRLLDKVATVTAAWGRISGRAPMLTPNKVRELTHPDWVCDNSSFVDSYSWNPKTDFAAGLRRTLAVDGKSSG